MKRFTGIFADLALRFIDDAEAQMEVMHVQDKNQIVYPGLAIARYVLLVCPPSMEVARLARDLIIILLPDCYSRT